MPVSLGSITVGLLGIFDKLAYSQGSISTLLNQGTGFWTRTDTLNADQTDVGQIAESRLKGFTARAMDAAWADFHLEDNAAFMAWMGEINTYFGTDLASSLDAWLTANRLRLDGRLAAMIARKYSQATLTLANIAAAGDAGAACPAVEFGHLTRGGSLVAGTDLVLTAVGTAPALARVAVKGSTEWDFNVTLKLWDNTTKVVAVVVAGNAAVGSTQIIGAQAISVASASGQKVVSVAATAQFKVGQKVLLTQFTGVDPDEVWTKQEWVTIATVTENASLTMVENLINDYGTSGLVYPLVKGVSAASGSGGDASDRVNFYPAPDRRLAL